jgi:hypothetical protein
MKGIAWTVFLTFIGISATANFLHGDDRLAGGLMAVVPIGFAAVMFLVESMAARQKGSTGLYLAAGVVALGAGVASYAGLVTMALDHKVPGIVAYLLPLAYDGVVVVASLSIRGAGSVHMTKPVTVLKSEMNTSMNTPANEEMNTSEGVQVNTDEPTVHADIPAAQAEDEHPISEPVNTEMNTPVDDTVNTSEGVHVNTPKKPAAKRVNTPKPKPVNTDKAEQMNAIREGLAAGKSLRTIASELSISLGKASNLKKEIEETVAEAMTNVDLDAEFAELLRNEQGEK